MKKIRLFLATAALSLCMAFSTRAGAWTHAQAGGKEDEHSWFYIKDNGDYARDEWILDPAGRIYWIDGQGRLPGEWGFDPAGTLYNGKGEYVNLADGKKYMALEAFAQLAEDMNYSQVVSIMGKEHEILSYQEAYNETSLEIAWYSHDGVTSAIAVFTDGLLSDFYTLDRG